MADNIVLKTYKGGNVTPQNDAIIYETAIPGSGIFRGCEVTYARGNVLHISQGFGMILGRFFEVYETEIDIRLTDIPDEKLNGRVYIHLDLSNTDEPIKILTQTGAELPPLDADMNLNYNNSSYDLELAVFTVSATGLDGLTKVFTMLKAGNGGGGTKVLARSSYYSVGDVITVEGVPGWATMVCTQAGTTATIKPPGYTNIEKVGDQVLDGTAIFTARDIIGELDSLEEDVTDLKETVGAMAGSAGLMLRLLSLDEYKSLENYDNNTIYLCYTDESTKRIVRIFVGKDSVYSAGIKVTYHIDIDDVIERTVLEMEDAIVQAPQPVMDGYLFIGWRQDDSAEGKVLAEHIIDTEKNLDLYAVFKNETDVNIRLMPNGGTLLQNGAKESFSAAYYYNNGNEKSEPVTIPQSPYKRNGMSFCGWSTDSFSPPEYKPGKTEMIPGECVLYAMWVTTEYDFPYTGTCVTFTIPQDGIYEFEVWGASGGDAKIDSLVAQGGLGGHSKGCKKMKRGEVIYVLNGGTANGIGKGLNGGGAGQTNTSTKKYCAGGGGSTHIATARGTLGDGLLVYDQRSKVLIVAGGGGGGGITDREVHKGGDGGGERGVNGSGGALGGRQISLMDDVTKDFGYLRKGPISGAYSGGGGGWFGGQFGENGDSGAGGSGYIDGVAPFTHNGRYYPAETEAGINKGNGKAFIRYIECI